MIHLTRLAIVSVGLFLTFSAFTLAWPAKPEEKVKILPIPKQAKIIVGWYKVKGSNATSDYEGRAKISKYKGDTYRFQSWFADSGGVTYGIGMLDGGRFVVGWGSAGTRGVTIYEIRKGGKELSGLWTAIPGSGEFQKETLTLQE